MVAGQRTHKDRLFQFLFGREERKEWTLQLYNAVNGSDYTDVGELEITTVQDILYVGMRNDVSFLMCGEMNLYEHQSTFNPNMPVRQMQNLGNTLERYMKERGLNKYGSRQLSLPVPRLVTFYNGTRKMEDERVLRLEDSFPDRAGSSIQVRVRMININYGRSPALMAACEPLREYAWLVEEIRKNQALQKKRKKVSMLQERPEDHEDKMTDPGSEGSGFNRGDLLGDAIDRALAAMPEEFVIRPLLLGHQAEVKGMLIDEYSETEIWEMFRRDGHQDGFEEGLEEGRQKGLQEGRQKGLQEGLREGESRMSRLTSLLLSSGRIDDLKNAADNETFRDRLFEEYHLLPAD